MQTQLGRPGLDAIEQYQSRFLTWDSWAAVRTRPRRMVKLPLTSELYFCPELVPVLSHPSLTERGLVNAFLLQHLYGYLDFTAVLEHRYVNQVTNAIASNRYPFDIPRGMKLDAYRIYCDEAYHALASADIIDQIAAGSGVEPIGLGVPHFFQLVDQWTEAADRRFRHLIPNLFVVVTETLISATLTDVHQDRRVVQAVREVIADHAKDEAVHHKYFSIYFGRIWSQMSLEEREFIAPMLADFIRGFLRPDFGRMIELLKSYGFSRSETDGIVSASYPEDKVAESTRDASRATRALFTFAGVFDLPAAQDAFGRAGLL